MTDKKQPAEYAGERLEELRGELKPCPLCGGGATPSTLGTMVCCAVDGCILRTQWFNLSIWQSLPRPTDKGTVGSVWHVYDTETLATVAICASEGLARAYLVGPESRAMARHDVDGAPRPAESVEHTQESGECACECDSGQPPAVCHRCYSVAKARAESAEARVKELGRLAVEAARIAYETGHNDTVESRYTDPQEVAEDIWADVIDENSSGRGSPPGTWYHMDECGCLCDSTGDEVLLEDACLALNNYRREYIEAVKAGDWARAEATDAKGRLATSEVRRREAEARVRELEAEIEQQREGEKRLVLALERVRGERDRRSAQLRRMGRRVKGLNRRLRACEFGDCVPVEDLDAARAEVERLKEGVQKILSGKAEWWLGLGPEKARDLLAQDLGYLLSPPQEKQYQKDTDLPPCPKCGKVPRVAIPGATVLTYRHPRGCTDTSVSEYCYSHVQWLRYVAEAQRELAENTPCLVCGELPAVYNRLSPADSGIALDCEKCSPDSPWTKRTPAEWIERNKQEDVGEPVISAAPQHWPTHDERNKPEEDGDEVQEITRSGRCSEAHGGDDDQHERGDAEGVSGGVADHRSGGRGVSMWGRDISQDVRAGGRGCVGGMESVTPGALEARLSALEARLDAADKRRERARVKVGKMGTGPVSDALWTLCGADERGDDD